VDGGRGGVGGRDIRGVAGAWSWRVRVGCVTGWEVLRVRGSGLRIEGWGNWRWQGAGRSDEVLGGRTDAAIGGPGEMWDVGEAVP